MNNLLLLPVLALLFFGCRKGTNDPELIIDPVPQVAEDIIDFMLSLL